MYSEQLIRMAKSLELGIVSSDSKAMDPILKVLDSDNTGPVAF